MFSVRAGGWFYFDEVTRLALDRRSYRALFDHPTQDRFTGPDFVRALEGLGLHVGHRQRTYIGGDYIIGVAERLTRPHTGLHDEK